MSGQNQGVPDSSIKMSNSRWTPQRALAPSAPGATVLTPATALWSSWLLGGTQSRQLLLHVVGGAALLHCSKEAGR